jgi:excisionase family DNA binding protein
MTIDEAIEAEVKRRVAAALESASEVPTVFTVDEAAAALKVSRSTVYLMIRDGEIVPSRMTRRVLIPSAEVARVLDVRKSA